MHKYPTYLPILSVFCKINVADVLAVRGGRGDVAMEHVDVPPLVVHGDDGQLAAGGLDVLAVHHVAEVVQRAQPLQERLDRLIKYGITVYRYY